jgi:hypothetical protein
VSAPHGLCVAPIGAVGDEPSLHLVLVRGRSRALATAFVAVTDSGDPGGAHEPGDPFASASDLAGHA